MSRQVSPFAALSGAEKQIRWLEYQSIQLPYVPAGFEENAAIEKMNNQEEEPLERSQPQPQKAIDRPQPPPEVPRTMADLQKTRHSQYDAVIARMKQAELQTRQSQKYSQLMQQGY